MLCLYDTKLWNPVLLRLDSAFYNGSEGPSLIFVKYIIS
jgi:hypothetical protein